MSPFFFFFEPLSSFSRHMLLSPDLRYNVLEAQPRSHHARLPTVHMGNVVLSRLSVRALWGQNPFLSWVRSWACIVRKLSEFDSTCLDGEGGYLIMVSVEKSLETEQKGDKERKQTTLSWLSLPILQSSFLLQASVISKTKWGEKGLSPAADACSRPRLSLERAGCTCQESLPPALTHRPACRAACRGLRGLQRDPRYLSLLWRVRLRAKKWLSNPLGGKSDLHNFSFFFFFWVYWWSFRKTEAHWKKESLLKMKDHTLFERDI